MRRLIYVISEFWKALDHEVFSDFAKKKQKTIRKQNGLGIFDTQSPSARSCGHTIGRTMVEQSVTKIFLANPEAVREEYVDGFGLTQAEFDIVAQPGNAWRSPSSWSSSRKGSAICELGPHRPGRFHHRRQSCHDRQTSTLLEAIRDINQLATIQLNGFPNSCVRSTIVGYRNPRRAA